MVLSVCPWLYWLLLFHVGIMEQNAFERVGTHWNAFLQGLSFRPRHPRTLKTRSWTWVKPSEHRGLMEKLKRKATKKKSETFIWTNPSFSSKLATQRLLPLCRVLDLDLFSITETLWANAESIFSGPTRFSAHMETGLLLDTRLSRSTSRQVWMQNSHEHEHQRTLQSFTYHHVRVQVQSSCQHPDTPTPQHPTHHTAHTTPFTSHQAGSNQETGNRHDK